MVGQKYATDLTDKQWNILRKLLPARSRRGRPPVDRREVINAILYLLRTGCQWRMLPRDFPNWNTVYGIYRKWVREGIWQNIHDTLRGRLRRAAGKKTQPTAGIIDSQSVRTAEGGDEHGYDAGKKTPGRKRHIVVDTLGLLLAVAVHSADWQDEDGACFVLVKLEEWATRLQVIFGDSAYGRKSLPQWVKDSFGWTLQTILRPVRAKGFVLLPKRWIVERTFAWIVRYRRHSRDYEKKAENSEAMIHITMIAIMTKRLARQI